MQGDVAGWYVGDVMSMISHVAGARWTVSPRLMMIHLTRHQWRPSHLHHLVKTLSGVYYRKNANTPLGSGLYLRSKLDIWSHRRSNCTSVLQFTMLVVAAVPPVSTAVHNESLRNGATLQSV